MDSVVHHSIPYRALSRDKKEFRLIELQPARNTDDPIVCRLVTLPLSCDVEFIALSSLYGDPAETDKICVNHKSVTITAHLSQAIKHVRAVFFSTASKDGQSESPRQQQRQQRHPNPKRNTPPWLQNFFGHVRSILPAPGLEREAPLRLWVDAICINQADDEEKSHQRIRISEIYWAARLVVGWLGLRSAHSDAGLAAMAELDAAMPPRWQEQADRDRHPENYAPRHVWAAGIAHLWATPQQPDNEGGDGPGPGAGRQEPFESAHWVGTFDIITRPYFQRRWILEELVKARVPTLLLDDCILSWERVLRLIQLMEEFRERESDVWPPEYRARIAELPLGSVHVLTDEFLRRRGQPGGGELVHVTTGTY